ncbi:MAG: hypothetical protein ACTSQQ_05935 [Candidatus Helarchaeota archaeon]
MDRRLDRENSHKTFEIIKDTSEEFTIKFNYSENRWFFIILIIIFSMVYFLILYYLGEYVIQPSYLELRLFVNVLVSIIFLSLIGLCAFFLIRSTFFKKIFLINKKMNIITIKKLHGILKTEEEIPSHLISNIVIKRNIIRDSVGIKRPSHYSLTLELSNGETINIFTTFNLDELKVVEELLIKNITV